MFHVITLIKSYQKSHDVRGVVRLNRFVGRWMVGKGVRGVETGGLITRGLYIFANPFSLLRVPES